MTGEPHALSATWYRAIQRAKPSHPKPSTEMARSTRIKKFPEPSSVLTASASPVPWANVFDAHTSGEVTGAAK